MPAKRDIHPIDRHVGGQLRQLRKARDVSQSDLAGALELSFQQVQKYETGANRISASMLVEIALALQSPITAFFEGLPAVTRPPAIGGDLDLADDLLASPYGAVVATHFPRLPLALQGHIAALIQALGAAPAPTGHNNRNSLPGRSRHSNPRAEIAPEAPGDAAAGLDGADDLAP